MKEQFIIREYIDADLNMVLDLWEFHSDWGRPKNEEFRQWLKTPFGDCKIYVAEAESGEIIGQMYLTPNELLINGRYVKVLKSSAPIIHSQFRSTSMFSQDSVLIRLIAESYKEILKTGFEWMYSFPAFGWMRLMQSLHHIGLNRWKVQSLKCIEITNNEKPDLPFKLELLDQFPERITELIDEFHQAHSDSFFLSRDIAWLNYKWGDDLKIGIFDNQNLLIGYGVIRPKDGLLLDLIVHDDAIIPDILILMNFFMKENSKSKYEAKKLKLMLTHFFQNNLQDLKTRIVDHQFVFGLSSLTNADLVDKLNLNDFYVFPMD